MTVSYISVTYTHVRNTSSQSARTIVLITAVSCAIVCSVCCCVYADLNSKNGYDDPRPLTDFIPWSVMEGTTYKQFSTAITMLHR
jgi:hypothetical protein